ncbi:MAG: type I restriction-modification system subunit M [Bacteroidales bacterium]|nr:type I restriction-modification system subunit M [Bacteroidales bacterium]MCM1146477.1 type I restriction-modification system subunit M [Bacteroidales bacterium]MCM1205085.1 type I restriction-modification system subunit M [Bacillota bacterium]MCM1509331.1 type I restriction-modification system subunit M [Clostridium sp.]
MNKQQLANKIWASANKMRSKIEANEYKDYILGFIFYKFLSDKEVLYLKDNGVDGDEMKSITEGNADAVNLLQQDLGYFISYENLFSTWLEMKKDFTVANVRDALSAFDRKINPNHKKLFDKIFETLQTGLSKLGASTNEQNAAVRDLVSLIREIPTDGRQDYDVLGFVYEYLISNFAANAGKKAGEFYTPHEVSVMMSDIIADHLKENDEIRIYDPTSGSGSLLISIGKSVSRHINDKNNIKYYAQELKQNTYNLTRMNLIMRGINPSNIEVRNGDTLKEDWPYFDESDPQGTYDPLYVDAVVSNPPYSQEWDPTDQETDPRYADFGVAPKGVADFAFLLHDLYHVKPSGIMTIVLPHGVLYRGGTELQIRSQLVEHNHIDAIIGLPEKVFFGTGISTIVMVLKRKTRVDENILFVDASRGFEKEGKNNKLRACDIKKIVDAVTKRTEEPDFSRLVSRETIRENEYNLNISRYVDGSDKPEKFDIYATMFGGIPLDELQSLSQYWNVFSALTDELFEQNELGYSHLKVENIRRQIGDNQAVCDFIENYHKSFKDMSDFLERILIEPMMTVNIQQTQSAISNNLFERLQSIPLVDRYQAYQFFSKDWERIAIDLEILQTEGFAAVRQVDPHMVVKNDNEIQDGWEGHVLPFDLIQEELLADDLAHINALRTRLETISDRYNQIIESFSADEKEKSILNDDNTKFVAGEIKKELKKVLDNIITPEIELLQTYPSSKKEKIIFVEQHPEIAWESVEPDKSGVYGKKQINTLIRKLQMDFLLEEDCYEAKIKEVASLIEEEKNRKEELKVCEKQLIDATISTIKGLTDEAAVDLLRKKWIAPLLASLAQMPGEVISELTEKIKHLADKYAVTYQDIANRVRKSEEKLHTLIGELQGETADMLGLSEFRQTLKTEK